MHDVQLIGRFDPNRLIQNGSTVRSMIRNGSMIRSMFGLSIQNGPIIGLSILNGPMIGLMIQNKWIDRFDALDRPIQGNRIGSNANTKFCSTVARFKQFLFLLSNLGFDLFHLEHEKMQQKKMGR
jgi:hypothetical protein